MLLHIQTCFIHEDLHQGKKASLMKTGQIFIRISKTKKHIHLHLKKVQNGVEG